MNPERVIIYRSRSEMELDNLLWSGDGTIFKVGIFCLVWVIVFFMLSRTFDNNFHKFKYTKIATVKGGVIATWVCGILAFPITYGVCILLNKLILWI